MSAGPLGTLLPGFVGTTLPDWLRARLEQGLAGVCLFGANIVDDAQLRALTAAITAANPTAVIAIDEEGGDVTRLAAGTGSPWPGNAVLGRLDDLALTAAVARQVAARLVTVGVTLNLAPVADVNSNPLNPVIGVRSFGADANLAARHVGAWVGAHEAVGVATCVKHFPGHGDVAVDSHRDLPVLDAAPDVLLARELVPFRAAIAAGASTIMTSHIVVSALDPARPATFAPTVLNGLLRETLGFTGVVVSDALDMRGASATLGLAGAAVAALDGGCDLLCLGPRTTPDQLDEVAAAVAAGVAPSRVEEAATRVAALARPTSPTPAQVLAAFAVRPGATVPAGARVVALETSANVAVGAVPWGLAAAGVAVTAVREGEPVPDTALVLVGKDNHRHAWVRALIDAARASRPTLVVDMGWPSPDRAYADVATFGASRLVGQALAQWLGVTR